MTDLRMCLGALAALVVVSGCGLISSDVTDFNLDLPEKKFSIDAASWDVDEMAAMTVLNATCSTDAQCNAAAEAACAMDCSGTCSPTTSMCELEMAVGIHQAVNLVMEKPELQSINDKPVIKVTIDSVTYEVTTNTLNVETPELQMYVAPMSVMDPRDPEAKLIGTIAPIAPGSVTTRPEDIVFTPEGETLLVDVMNNYKTPFNIIVGSNLTVAAGQPIPTGKLDAVVHIRAHAGI